MTWFYWYQLPAFFFLIEFTYLPVCYAVAALVEALSAAVLIVLFLLKKFGTSRVSFLFSPIMGAWTLSTHSSEFIALYIIIQVSSRLYYHITSFISFGEMERKASSY